MGRKKKISKEVIKKAEKINEEEKATVRQLEQKRLLQHWISCTIQGRYFMARHNMLAKAINNVPPGDDPLDPIKVTIDETVDGGYKTLEYALAEAAVFKKQAIDKMREAYFTKKELLDKFKVVEEEFVRMEEDYYNGKIVRETYDESDQPINKSRFVQ